MKKIDIILQYLDKKGISISEFERSVDMSNGYLQNTAGRGADISEKMLEKIKTLRKEDYQNIFPEKEKAESQEDLSILIKNSAELIESHKILVIHQTELISLLKATTDITKTPSPIKSGNHH